jgi:hypothetical protein
VAGLARSGHSQLVSLMKAPTPSIVEAAWLTTSSFISEKAHIWVVAPGAASWRWRRTSPETAYFAAVQMNSKFDLTP